MMKDWGFRNTEEEFLYLDEIVGQEYMLNNAVRFSNLYDI